MFLFSTLYSARFVGVGGLTPRFTLILLWFSQVSTAYNLWFRHKPSHNFVYNLSVAWKPILTEVIKY